MKFAQLSTDELEDMKTSNGTAELGLFGITFGSFLTVTTTLLTVPMADSATHASFVAANIVFVILSVYFAIGAVRGQARWRKKINSLIEGARS